VRIFMMCLGSNALAREEKNDIPVRDSMLHKQGNSICIYLSLVSTYSSTLFR
jgi:hypothetical protein